MELVITITVDPQYQAKLAAIEDTYLWDLLCAKLRHHIRCFVAEQIFKWTICVSSITVGIERREHNGI